MTKKTNTTNKKRFDLSKVDHANKQNTLGMTEVDYKAYQQRLVNEYKDNDDLSMKDIVNREQKKGIKLYYPRFRRWIKKFKIPVSKRGSQPKLKHGAGRTYAVYIRNDQYRDLSKFESKAQFVRLGIDFMLGNPTDALILFFGPQKNIVFIKDNRTMKIEAYIIGDLTEFETKTIQKLVNKANKFGVEYVEKFAIENEIKYYGNNEAE